MMELTQDQDLTIIILTYNSSGVIERCMKGLNFAKYQVIIVDNASRDNTVEVVRNKFPHVEVIKLPLNIGYGNGNNIALNKVVTDFALVLNPDAVILEKDIDIVLQEMKNSSDIALAAAIMLKKFSTNKEELDEKNKLIEEDYRSKQGYYFAKNGNSFVSRFLSGSALFMNMSIMKKVGFFDGNFFLYYEDNEICKRVLGAGYQNIIIPEASFVHAGGESSGTSMRVLFKKSWHMVWSKIYWKRSRKGVLSAKRSAVRFTIAFFVKFVFSLVTFNRHKFVINSGSLLGALSSLVGFGAFKSNGSSRG